MTEYKTSNFDYALPEELIAQKPLARRTASRMLCVDIGLGSIEHHNFLHIKQLLRPGDLLVLNNTRVIPARLYGVKQTGGKVECLIERIKNHDAKLVLAHIRASKAPKIGMLLNFADSLSARVVARQAALFELEFLTELPVLDALYSYGELPLPPYITREADNDDLERYQTVFATSEGAVAAPTAGLHFDADTLRDLSENGINSCQVTLHVGAGTFQPVRSEDLAQHKMHYEYMELSESVCEQVRQTKSRGGRVIAIGTTTVRSLETAAKSGSIMPYVGDTNLFIYPGFKFNCVDAILTNFHLPKSTLLMLVCAFAGYSLTLKAYGLAVMEQYRFFSYGDAMFLHNCNM